MSGTLDSKSFAFGRGSSSLPGATISSSLPSNIDQSENFEDNQTEEYNPLEWAKYMAQAKEILGEATSVAKEYETITKDDGIIQ